jgi:hypothetical protein
MQPPTLDLDPCDAVIESWRSQVAGDALARRQESDLIMAIRSVKDESDSGQEKLLEAIDKLKLGIARLAIGHRPFEEAAGRYVTYQAPGCVQNP